MRPRPLLNTPLIMEEEGGDCIVTTCTVLVGPGHKRFRSYCPTIDRGAEHPLRRPPAPNLATAALEKYE